MHLEHVVNVCVVWCTCLTRDTCTDRLLYLYDTWYTYGSLVVLVGHVVHVPDVCCAFRTRGARTGRFICLYFMLCTYGSLGVFVEHVLVAWYVFRHVVHVHVACRTRVVGLVCRTCGDYMSIFSH